MKVLDFPERLGIVRPANHKHAPIDLHVVFLTSHEVYICILVPKRVIILFSQAALLDDGVAHAPSEHFPGLLRLVGVQLEHCRVGHEFWHDSQRDTVGLQRAHDEKDEREKLHRVVHRANLAHPLERREAGYHCAHPLECAPFEREKDAGVRGRSFGENGERRVINAAILDHSLPLDYGLHYAISFFDCATATDVERLKAVGELVEEWHRLHFFLRCEAGMDRRTNQ